MGFTSWDCPTWKESCPGEGAASGPAFPKGKAATSLPGATCAGSLKGYRGTLLCCGVELVSFLQPVLYNCPRQGVTWQHLKNWALLLKAMLLSQRWRSMRWWQEHLDASLSLRQADTPWCIRGGWASVGTEDNATTITQGKQTARVLTSQWCREPNTVFSSAAGGTDLSASGDVKQRWSLETSDAENSTMLVEAFRPHYGALACPQLHLQSSPKGIKKVSAWSLCLQLHPSGNCSGIWELKED